MMGRRLGIGMAAGIGASLMALHLIAHGPVALSAQPRAPTPGPYAGQQASSIRGLTEAEIADFREGRGMGLARPAEINGYPGPIHVLELGGALGLSDEQRAAVQALHEQMKAEAVPLGEQFLHRYGQLEATFRDGTITHEALDGQTAELGALDGALRATHLKYHLLTKAVLTDEQVAAYSRLRGYNETAPSTEHRPGTGHHPGRGHPPAP